MDPTTLWAVAGTLAEAPDLLDQVAQALRGLGLVGEERNGKLIYLAATARLLTELVHIIVKGPSSVGKSYLLKLVLMLFPPSAFVDYTSVSPKYLAYCDDDLRHRIVVLYEAGGIAEGMGAYIMRSLLSEGRLNCGTVDKDASGANTARQLIKEGPTALFTSTTRVAVDAELETRLVSVSATDTPAHSRAIVEGQARAAEGDAPQAPDLAPFHALQDWLAVAGLRAVRIPFARALARLVPSQTLRIRRDFPKLLSLIKACALLHQAQRTKTADGVVLASVDDYAIVRDLLAEAFAAAQQDGLTPTQREAVAAIETLCQEASTPAAGVSLKAVAGRLGIDKSAASRRLANPLEHGYVRNLNVDGQGKSVRGKAAAYVIGEPLPPELTALPAREAVEEAWNTTLAPCNGATLQRCDENPAPAPDTGVAEGIAVEDGTATVESVAVEDDGATVAATPPGGAETGETGDPLQRCSVADPSDERCDSCGEVLAPSEMLRCTSCAENV